MISSAPDKDSSLLDKAKAPCSLARVPGQHTLPKVCCTAPTGFKGRLKLQLGRRQKTSACINLRTEPPTVPESAEPVVPGALCSLGSTGSLPLLNLTVHVYVHPCNVFRATLLLLKDIYQTTTTNSSHQATISTQATFTEMENK